MKRIITITTIMLLSAAGFGQQEAMLSQYMFNKLFLNPGFAGSHDNIRTTLNYRSQWVSFEGAPKTAIFAIDAPLSNRKMGAGLIVANDKIGATSQTDVIANYAYHLTLDKKSVLSFGVRGGMSNYRINFSDLQFWDDSDPVYREGTSSFYVPKFGFGTYYHRSNFYAGFSIPTLLAYQKGRQFSMNVNKGTMLDRHYFVHSGYSYKVNKTIRLEPSALMKYLPGAPLQADLNMNVVFKDEIRIGASYRTGDAILGMVEYRLQDQFRIGYAFDYTVSMLNSYSKGTHEVMLGYNFGGGTEKGSATSSARFY